MTQQLSALFIRPPRQTYYDHDLGPQLFPLASKQYSRSQMATRIDFSFHNNRNLKINASFYQLQKNTSDKCLIYLHTHHGSRLQATCLVQPLLQSQINLCLFDFSGYGNSQGDTVTLGLQQSQDIHYAIQSLKNKFEQQYFILWGRSMGAVASIIYLAHSQKQKQKQNHAQSVIGAVFDSPFHSLYELTLQLGSQNLGIPQVLLRPLMYLVKRSLEQKLNFEELQLEDIVANIKTPCVFVASKSDRFVSSNHSQKLYSKYAGPKQLIYIDKDHNEPRKQSDLSAVFSFIQKRIASIKREDKLNNYINLITKHFTFLQNTKCQNKKIKEKQQPEKIELKRDLKLDFNKSNSALLSARQNNVEKSTKTSNFSKTQRFGKFKHVIDQY